MRHYRQSHLSLASWALVANSRALGALVVDLPMLIVEGLPANALVFSWFLRHGLAYWSDVLHPAISAVAGLAEYVASKRDAERYR